MAELKPVVEARLRGAEEITQVVEDEVMTSLRRVLSASLCFGRSKEGRGFGRIKMAELKPRSKEAAEKIA